MPCCSDIVTIGRVKWIEGSKHTGKENHAWYRFDARHRGGPVLHNNRGQGEVIPSRRTRVCEQCRKPYEPQRSSSRFCSGTCRQHAHRKRLLSVTPSVTPAPTPNTLIEPSNSSEVFRYVRRVLGRLQLWRRRSVSWVDDRIRRDAERPTFDTWRHLPSRFSASTSPRLIGRASPAS
jgi:hypothetical protein